MNSSILYAVTNIPSCVQMGELGDTLMNGKILYAVTNIPSCVQMGELGGLSDERQYPIRGH